jgi:transcriptional regulator with XRE-family HTH domain
MQSKSHVNEPPPHAAVGRAFRSAREQLGWSQENFADKAGCVVGTVKRAEKGHHLRPKIHHELVQAINRERARLMPKVEPFVLTYPSKENEVSISTSTSVGSRRDDSIPLELKPKAAAPRSICDRNEPVKIAEWIWEDHLVPSAVFLNDEIVAIGGSAASMTTMDFSTRKVLSYICDDTVRFERLREESALELMQGKGRRNSMYYQIAARRYLKMTLSPDGALLACYRNKGLEYAQDGEIDVWDVLKSDSPRKVAILPSGTSNSFCLEGNILCRVPAFSFMPHSGEIILHPYEEAQKRVIIVHSRSGELIKSIELQKPTGREPSDYLLVKQILTVPLREDIALLPLSRDRLEKWLLINPRKKKSLQRLKWPRGLAVPIPGTAQVICTLDIASDLRDALTGACNVQIWDWTDSKVADLSAKSGWLKTVAFHPNGETFALGIISQNEDKVEQRRVLSSDENNSVVVQVFSKTTWKEMAQFRLPLASRLLAVHICRTGKIRIITALRFVPHKHIQCQLTFWEMDIGWI